MRRAVAADSLRRLFRALLLPMLLLVAQQGAFLHGLTHHAPAHVHGDEHEHEHEHGAGGPCSLCLAFAGVDCAAGFSAGPAPLPPCLRVALPAVAPVAMRPATVPARRNRGPPPLG